MKRKSKIVMMIVALVGILLMIPVQIKAARRILPRQFANLYMRI